MRARPSDPRQRTFDFSRAQQIGLLRCAALRAWQDRQGVGCSAAALTAVLRAIDAAGQGHPATIPLRHLERATQLGRRTLTRAIAGLIDLGLLIVCRTAGAAAEYRIVWSELALWVPPPASMRQMLIAAQQQPLPTPPHPVHPQADLFARRIARVLRPQTPAEWRMIWSAADQVAHGQIAEAELERVLGCIGPHVRRPCAYFRRAWMACVHR